MIAPTDLPTVVRAAQDGDEQAWAELVERFQDRAVATALGWSGRWVVAADIAQDAFRLAHLHLADLEEPAAFGAWFAQVVRTACSRATRTPRLSEVPLDSVPEGLVAYEADPSRRLVDLEAAAAVRDAVERLPATERVVVALFYLADMSYPQIASFLGIGLSAAKKRGVTARRHLKELLPMTADAFAAARPSRTGKLRDTVLVFSAIHRRDVEGLRALVAARPSLAQAQEDWTPEEAVQGSIGYATHATALIRAAETGVVEMARILLDAGAPVDGHCGCEGGETPLWAATIAGKTDMVAALLEAGADPGTPAFRGATPLHAAVQRGRDDLVPVLVAAGADPGRVDAGGRTPADWSRRRARPACGEDGETMWTGIRALDLFAPVRRGSLQWWPAGYGLGQLVLAAALGAALDPVEVWYIGFDQPHVDGHSIRHGLEECNLDGYVHLAARSASASQRRRGFADAVARLRATRSDRLAVFCLSDRGHAHDIELILPALARDRRVLTAVVIEPSPGDDRLSAGPPEGYHQQVAFESRRAARGLYPALDPGRTVAASYADERHRRLADAVRACLAGYETLDPQLALPDPAALGGTARAAQDLIRYLAQPIGLAEPFTSEPAQVTAPSQLLDRIEELLGPIGR